MIELEIQREHWVMRQNLRNVILIMLSLRTWGIDGYRCPSEDEIHPSTGFRKKANLVIKTYITYTHHTYTIYTHS